MTNKATVRHRFAAVFAGAALVLTVAAVDARNFTPASQTLVAEDDPDFLVLNPEGE
jgi:hypothetical protein